MAAAINDADSALAGVASSQVPEISRSSPVKETIVGRAMNQQHTGSRDGSTSSASSMSSVSRKELDFKHNDNTFHVVANLILEKFQAKMTPGDTFLTLDAADIAHLDQIAPHNVRISFVEAVRYRLEHNCPPNSDLNIHALTRECGDIGLARHGNDNPLLATLNAAGMKAITIAVPPLRKHRNSGSLTNPARPGIPPPYPGTHSSAMPISVPPTRGDASVASAGGSTITGVSVTEAHVSTTESLARQQLMAELREASNLMAESVTPEAATFWRNHVVDLQARLRALHGEGSGDTTRGQYEHTPISYHQGPVYEPAFPDAPPTYQPEPKAKYEPPHQQQSRESIAPPKPVAPAPEKRSTGGRGRPIVDVIAPAALPGGYHFEAEIQGRRFLAVVPAGGVKKGETFSCLMRDLEIVAPGVPVGRWRDRLCDCCNYGITHALFCNALFCPLLALGQVMTRLNYDFLGRPSPVKRTMTAYCTMWSIVIFAILMNSLIYAAYCYKWSFNMPLSYADIAASVLLNACLVAFTISATSAARATLRDKYMIREHRFFDLEDCCCATFCMPCTICQMGRHTVNYDEVDAVCCSANGLSAKPTNSTKNTSGYII